ncbi:MAG TPA: pirin family protein [Acidimicrobiia bacterium]|nr:pirin family protein [Acidimicrobiia bacterium]
MSGPVEETTLPPNEGFGVSTIEVKEGRSTHLGEMGILRVLPTKGRRSIGPWCFVDLMSPDNVDQPPPLEVGPHPHIGLSTVTWLFAGTVLHTDSLNNQQPIRPGELNLMTSGRGIAHAEEGIEPRASEETGGIMGAQMWLAQPESTRNGSNGFQHHEDLPEVDLIGATARILIGEHNGTVSPTRFEHPAIGIDLTLRRPLELEAKRQFEYAVVPIDRPVKVEDAIAEPGSLAVLPTGFESFRLETQTGVARVLVLGGLPLGVELKMWWNFVARTAEEITEAWRDWQNHNEERFGPVPSTLARIDAPPPPWLRAAD